MHDFTTDEIYRAKKIANERNLDRFRKAVSQARTPEAKIANQRNLIRFRTLISEARTQIELKMARLMLAEQEEIALALILEYPRRLRSSRPSRTRRVTARLNGLRAM